MPAKELIKQLHLDHPSLHSMSVPLKKGDILFKEGQPLSELFFIEEGEVRLCKKSLHNPDEEFLVDILHAGKVVGIMAFATRHPSLTTAMVIKEGRAIRIPMQGFYQSLEKHPRLYHTIMGILTKDLGERYRHSLFSALDIEKMNHQIDEERSRLRKALNALREAQTKLVQKEKMATLGQLTAGFAHEVNNPAAALIRATDVLTEQLPALMANPDIKFYFTAGLQSGVTDTEQLRLKSKEVAKKFGHIKRSKQRMIAQMDEEVQQALAKHPNDDQERMIDWYECGKYLRNIDLSGKRIAGLVQSMKNYARQDKEKPEPIDIRSGIHDSLLVLSNRTKFYKLKLELHDIPKVNAIAGSLNQVWTNLIINACDAMGKEGFLAISTEYYKDEGIVQVRFEDTGGGVRDEVADRIFESNFSTKDTDTKFGLGLGLNISQKIILQHKGEIGFYNTENGSCFWVKLPVTSQAL